LLGPPVLVLDEPTSKWTTGRKSVERTSCQESQRKNRHLDYAPGIASGYGNRLIVIDNGSIMLTARKIFVIEAMKKGQLHL